MTNHTAALKAGPMPQRLMLWELAPLVARALCEQRDEATGVQDGDLKPPAAWRPELKNRRLEYIKRELTIALEQFDSSDPFVATTSLAHARKRKEYEAQKRKMVAKRAPRIVARLIANEKKQQATEEIQLALRAAMMDPETTVRATSEAGERRQLDRAEIVEAGIDHVRNRLEIRGNWWRDVEVECPPTIKAPPSPDAPDNDTPSDKVVNAYLVLEQARRIDADEKCGKNEVRLYLPKEFPHLSRDDADRFYDKLDSSLRPTTGPRGPWKNKRQSQ